VQADMGNCTFSRQQRSSDARQTGMGARDDCPAAWVKVDTWAQML